MNWRRPSLLKRLALGLVLSSVLLAGGLGIALQLMDGPYLPVEDAVDTLEDAVRDGPAGTLSLSSAADVVRLRGRNPGLWALVVDSRGRQLALGRPPQAAATLLAGVRATRAPVFSGMNFQLAGDPPVNRARLEQIETRAGPALLVVGGVRAQRIGLLSWVTYASAVVTVALVPVLIVLAFVVWLIVAPLVLRGIRPVAAAAAEIDGSDPARRLPERGVMSELLPIVRAFNGALDRLEHMLERRRRFIADAAHELRTPLAVLTMHVEALPESDTKADLQRGVFRLTEMTGQMLDAERLRGAGRDRRQPLDLVAAAKAAAADAAPLALGAGYELTFASELEPVLIRGDPHAVRRAVNNLLGNAIAHGGGAGLITVRVGADGTVEVLDQGPGLAEAERERVFEPFHRERWDRDGCGLGLHLVREIMHAHGGRAEVVSAAGPGACFRLSFPVLESR